MVEWPYADKQDIHDLKQRLDNTETAIALILVELSKQIDTKEVLEAALRRASAARLPQQVTLVLDKMKWTVITSLNRDRG